MHFSEEQLKIIEEMGYRLFPPYLVAINLEINEDDFIDEIHTPKSSARTAYYKGLIRHKNDVHEKIISAAINGSNPAQDQLIKLLQTLYASLDG